MRNSAYTQIWLGPGWECKKMLLIIGTTEVQIYENEPDINIHDMVEGLHVQ